ncbi:protein PHOTOSYSTEM I ASSEMBLY 2, chloroplastic isoform X1 [Abrus precatorius]|uniref:Protein PHOTOSYSTEM I ASSEMBLY 2, chloroplastic isoform X1 n=1 Tax=Abrus precatorius TaxID=3816 RepID=A0A8B8LJ73_ABRPR|nr:protein PHOTOSYSTEM I ASSEMBLY 2, chloroplastic isoform X1 [Abrus precatorius]
MHQISVCCNGLAPPPPSARQPPLQPIVRRRHSTVTAFAAKSGGFSLNSILKNCQTCGGKGAIECPGCKGSGKNKKNGNIFERWKCFDCQGFGLKSCPSCGKGGLTPEQRGER